MSQAVHATLLKFHASLNVTDLPRAIAFYRVLLGVEPAKVRQDYAKFELAEPPIILSLIPGRSNAGLNHVGLRVRTTEELVEVQRRLETAGISTKREEGVECCYARQTKFWVSDPDGMLWEIYVFHEDIEERGDGSIPISALTSTAAVEKARWTHRLGEPFPEKIPHDANVLTEIALEGSMNADPSTEHRRGLMSEAFRVLRPGGEVHMHGLTGDQPCPVEKLNLPGPAAVVQYVPTPSEITEELADRGFADVHIETLSQTAHFIVGGVPMRECRIRAKKPGHRPKQKSHHAIYRGPLAQVTDDYGNVFRRGELTALNVHDWQMLSKCVMSSSFLLLEPKNNHER